MKLKNFQFMIHEISMCRFETDTFETDTPDLKNFWSVEKRFAPTFWNLFLKRIRQRIDWTSIEKNRLKNQERLDEKRKEVSEYFCFLKNCRIRLGYRRQKNWIKKICDNA